MARFERFKDEEEESNHNYPSNYKPKSIADQISRLNELFPGIGCADEQLFKQKLPPDAEGWFAIPRWNKIDPTYGEVVQKVLDLITEARNGAFFDYTDGELDSRYLRQSKKSIKAFQELDDKQKDYNILVIPAQFGLRHRGRSVRRAREVMGSHEFGLGAFAVGIMLLTHLERIQAEKDLRVDCAGDEYSLRGDGEFEECPFFDFSDADTAEELYGNVVTDEVEDDDGDEEDDRDEIGFNTTWIGDTDYTSGSASGFIF